MLTSYFGGLGDTIDAALSLSVAGLHLDLVRAPEQLDEVAAKAPQGLVLSLGVIDGRNIWRADLPTLLDRLEPVVAKRGIDHVQLAPSCSLLHIPIDLELETNLDADLKSWLAFSVQKMSELATLGQALAKGRVAVEDTLAASSKAAVARKTSPKVHDAAVATRIAGIVPDDAFRTYKYPNEIGPGVYDIHSPRVPAVNEMTNLLDLARQRLSDGQLWVNPDCGLKTRSWEEVRPALENMVDAARQTRHSLSQEGVRS